MQLQCRLLLCYDQHHHHHRRRVAEHLLVIQLAAKLTTQFCNDNITYDDNENKIKNLTNVCAKYFDETTYL